MSQSENRSNESDAFEFALPDVPEREPLYADAVTEFFRQQILNLLDVVVLTTNGAGQDRWFCVSKEPGRKLRPLVEMICS